MFGEIEGNKQGLVPIESVVQYLRMVSRDNRKIKVKIKIGTLIEDYEDVDIDIKIFTVGVTKNPNPLFITPGQEIVRSLAQCGWRPYNKDDPGVIRSLSTEQVFQLVDINSSGLVTRTVSLSPVCMKTLLDISLFQEIKLAENLLKKRYGIENVGHAVLLFYNL